MYLTLIKDGPEYPLGLRRLILLLFLIHLVCNQMDSMLVHRKLVQLVQLVLFRLSFLLAVVEHMVAQPAEAVVVRDQSLLHIVAILLCFVQIVECLNVPCHQQH